MAGDIKLKAGASPTSLLTTGLDSLADGSRALSADYDSSSELDSRADIELAVAYTSSAPSAGARVADLYLLPSIDGTHYAEGGSSLTPQGALFIGAFESRNGSTSSVEYLVLPGIEIPPGHMKFLLVNKSGKSYKSSGNTLKIRPWRHQYT